MGGRGLSPNTSYTDMIFILLSVLHIPKKAEAHAQGFELKKTMFDNCLTKVSETLFLFQTWFYSPFFICLILCCVKHGLTHHFFVFLSLMGLLQDNQHLQRRL